ncbi:ATP-dependent DNA helicase RecG, partial [Candidatus Saccharibacteria bacterium]|nr:ATP-dependent DNA helicase RecG [Candidatus Saccharibacteria bacterium]
VWFNQPYRAKALKKGHSYYISGEYQLRRGRFSITNPSVEVASDIPINAARILAVYRETKGLTSRQIRFAVEQARDLFPTIPETLPEELIKKHTLLSRAEALHTLHAPASQSKLEMAKRRLGFEEVLQLSLASLLNKQENQKETALTITFKEELARKFVEHLKFTLTDAQRKAIWRIYLDMEKIHPMNRLLEGDVGSGKTVVAAMAALMVMDQGRQVAIMAPTELLARQHAETLHALLKPLNKHKAVGLLVGSLTTKQKEKAREAIATGDISLIVGTHALIQEKVAMDKLALVVIDEQHRFGVEQRKALMVKAGHMPHVLNMTATPIPRTLALTLYGELDISVLAEKPKNRLPIITKLVSPNSTQTAYADIEQKLAEGQQMFVVCPLISESSELEASSAEATYEKLSKGPFKHRRIGLLHGKLKPQAKQHVMEQFVAGKLDILVSTTVIEVGVDVPNASIMMIESAERFGLAQLHQLRGRDGRSGQQGYCYLMLDDSKSPSRRLQALETTNDGFKLAELDLELRGPGAIYGVSQHGQLDLRIAQLSDTRLIAEARNAAQELLDDKVDLLNYTHLMQQVNRLRAVTNLN